MHFSSCFLRTSKNLVFSKAAGILSGLVLQSCYSFSAELPLMFHIIKIATLFLRQFIALLVMVLLPVTYLGIENKVIFNYKSVILY